MAAFYERLMFWRQAAAPAAILDAEVMPDLMDLPLRREAADVRVALSQASLRAGENRGALQDFRTTSHTEGIQLPWGMGMDQDENLYRRLTGDAKHQRRDLSPLAQDRMLEVAYFLWESNTFAKRLVTLMTDLILGQGIKVVAADQKNQEVIDRTWNHRENKLDQNIRSFYNSLSVNGELALPVAANPISGISRLGFIDPYQIKDIVPLPDNILVPDIMVLKAAPGQTEQRLKIVREDPMTEKLVGEVFFFKINTLPNGLRGRSDLGPVADWLDLYDQFLFGELERVNLLSNFVWDWKIDGADDAKIKEKLKNFPKPKPGQVFAHNEHETLEAQTPDLKASDRSEVARMLRVHIAGSMGYPISYLGDTDSNRATIEGQNDIMLKTPAARQREFASMVDQIVRFGIENAQTRNPGLFRDVKQGYVMHLPEISAKDISRVGQVASSLITGMDTALNNRTLSRKAAVDVTCTILKQLGVDLDAQEVMEQADEDAAEAQDRADDIAAGMAASRANNPNPPIAPDPEDDPEDPEDLAD